VKALIFAAGLGTRLKPFTETMPKALVPVGGKSLLEHTISKLRDAGVTEIIINVHHFADQIIDFVHSKNDFNLHITFSDERDLLLDTGGGLKKVAEFLDGDRPFFVHNVDILSNVNLRQMYFSHIQSQSLCTLFVSKRKTNRYLLFNREDKLKGWYNTQTGEIKPKGVIINPLKYNQLAFNGIHVISPKIFTLMNDWQGQFSIIDFYLSIIEKSNIQLFQEKDVQIIDVGKIASLKEAERFYKKFQ